MGTGYRYTGYRDPGGYTDIEIQDTDTGYRYSMQTPPWVYTDTEIQDIQDTGIQYTETQGKCKDTEIQDRVVNLFCKRSLNDRFFVSFSKTIVSFSEKNDRF